MDDTRVTPTAVDARHDATGEVLATRRDWVRALAFIALILATIVLSYATLRDRALHSGFAPWTAWLYPFAIDAGIIVASRTWADPTLSRATRWLAAVVTLGSILAGVAAFVVEHLPDGRVAVVFAALIPLALAAAITLISWSADDRRDRDAAQRDLLDATTMRRRAEAEHADATRLREEARARRDAAQQIAREMLVTLPTTPAVTRRTAPSVASNGRRVTRGKSTPKERRDWILAQLDGGRDVTGADVDHEFGGRNGARDVKAVKAQRPALHSVERTA